VSTVTTSRTAPSTLIESILPRYEVIERHQTFVRATAAECYRSVTELDMAASPLTMVLMTLRGLPHLLSGTVKPSLHLRLRDMVDAGFVVLADSPPHEIVLGVVGRFWRPASGIVRLDKEQFLAFNAPGYARAAMNFQVVAADGGCAVQTETRVDCLDEGARRRFLLYWRIVGPFSALIRHEMLRRIRLGAEAVAPVDKLPAR
jgi:hypothetical protein